MPTSPLQGKGLARRLQWLDGPDTANARLQMTGNIDFQMDSTVTRAPLPALPGFIPRQRSGLTEFPVHHMRGGTSTGLVLWERLLPRDTALREELLRHLMGVPHEGEHPGNRQITGLGRGPATSNKVFLADMEVADTQSDTPRLVSTLAQLASGHGRIDWSVNCGNMSAALPLWAMDTGLLAASHADRQPCAPDPHALGLDIHNTNTGVITAARMQRCADGHLLTCSIPGVDGQFPAVDLFLQRPVGAKTGKLLPTGHAHELVLGRPVSCVDVAVPMVIAEAAAFGKTALESIDELETDAAFMEALRAVWIEAGLKMGLRRRDGQLMTREDLQRSETIPKVCIVGAPRGAGQIAVRYFTPQTGHASMAVSGGCCLAAACLIPGTVAHRVASGLQGLSGEVQERQIGMENPAGILEATVLARQAGLAVDIQRVAYRRSAQILLRGHVPLYRASPALRKALLDIARTLATPERAML